jgi:hypothetical protein
MPAILTICAAHAPEALSVKRAVELLAGQLVAQPRAGHRVALDEEVDHPVVGEDAGAVGCRAARQRPHGLPAVDRGVVHRERALDAGVQTRLHPQRLGDVDLLAGQVRLAAALEEPVAVLRVVVRRDDEQPAGVLDAVRDDAAQDRVLLDALDRRHAVLDHIAPAGVQQAVEAAARALGQVGALDEDRVEAAQCRVPGDAGAGGTTADHQDIGLEARHRASLPLGPAQRPTKERRVRSRQTTQRSPPALAGLCLSLAPHSAVPGCVGSSACLMGGRLPPRRPWARGAVEIIHRRYPHQQGLTQRFSQDSASNQSKVRVTAFFQYL